MRQRLDQLAALEAAAAADGGWGEDDDDIMGGDDLFGLGGDGDAGDHFGGSHRFGAPPPWAAAGDGFDGSPPRRGSRGGRSRSQPARTQRGRSAFFAVLPGMLDRLACSRDSSARLAGGGACISDLQWIALMHVSFQPPLST